MGNRILGVGLTGTSLTDLERRLLQDTPPYAVILFGRNVESAEQLLSLVGDIKSQSSEPPLIMIDEEGGRVDRLREIVPGLPSAEAFDEGQDAEELVTRFGNIVGQALRYFQIDINLAPVVDVRKGEGARGLERRCFGDSPQRVIELAGRFMRGQHEAGVASCLKHFPGLGAGSGDSHYGPSVVDLTEDELETEALGPYRWLSNEARAVMIGHALYPRIEDPSVPASLSRRIATDLLRGRLGFDGLAISDDMEMHAVSDLGSYNEICARALVAGNDVIMLCSHVEKIPEVMSHLQSMAASNPMVGARFNEAVFRADAYREHCRRLKEAATLQKVSFEGLFDLVNEFCEDFEASRILVAGSSTGAERRERPRTAGTGKTGREEWT